MSLQNSKLHRIDRLTRFDDYLVGRVRAACAIKAIDYSNEVLLAVAASDTVLEHVTVDELGAVSSDDVPDEAILAVIDGLMA